MLLIVYHAGYSLEKCVMLGNRKKVQWAKMHKHWILDEWSRVLWTDESMFEVFGSK